LPEAERFYREVLAKAPNHAESLHLLGVIASQTDRQDLSITLISKAIAVNPKSSAYYYNLGLAYQKQGKLAEAVACWKKSTKLEPRDAIALANLGSALSELGQAEEAIPYLRKAIALNPHYASAHTNLGNALEARGHIEEAIAAHQQAIRLKPDFSEAHNNLGGALQKQAKLPEAMDSFAEALRLRPSDVNYHRNFLLSATYRDDLDNAALKEFHLRFGDAFAKPVSRHFSGDLAPERQLRIGYISSDLCDHPVARNLLPMLRQQDGQSFATYFYADVLKPDQTSLELQKLAAGWRSISGLSDAQAAELIRADGVDILVCLAARFDRNRPTICAYRAAPIQISMHDVATSGLAEMDYLIADRWLSPKSSSEFFRERVLRLPCFPIFDPPVDLPASTNARSEGPPVFACFNNPVKITPSTLALWGRVLAALPEARLVLKYHYAYRSQELRDRYLALLTEAGAKPEQIDFLQDKETLFQTLKRYNDIDLALDCFPFSGSTTSFQALSMGTPVITWPWDRMSSRWTETMLRAIGLEEMIAASPDEFVEIAVNMVGALERNCSPPWQAWLSTVGVVTESIPNM
jgi:protein O-GlcNAc transferase